MEELEQIKAIKREHTFSLLCRAGVVGVGVGHKQVHGKPTETPSITIVVERKIKKSRLPIQERLPSEIDGIPTDVICMSGDEPFVKVRLRESRLPNDDRTKRWRPAPGGVSVGHYRLQGAGTLGAWVTDPRSGEPLLLSCWHVIANMGDCKKGDPVLQPAVLDGGKYPGDIIAYLDRWIDVEMIVPSLSLQDARQRLRELLELKCRVPTNQVDAAVARPISDDVVSKEILGLGQVGNLGCSDREMLTEIGKQIVGGGRTTGLTRGTIKLVDVELFVVYPTGVALFA